MLTLQDRFRGCLLGAMLGDVIGAAVEAESPAYIAKAFPTIDDILSMVSVPEFAGPDWQVGRFTDDTQMSICVAEWLIEDDPPTPEKLIERFASAFERWRRYGSGTEAILRMYPQHRRAWRELSTVMFPHGSYGNGSAMRVAPIGLAYRNNPSRRATVAVESSRPTHSHPVAYQGCVLQATALATAASSGNAYTTTFLPPLRGNLTIFAEHLQDTSGFEQAINRIESGIARDRSCMDMSQELGTGIEAVQAVPMAIYCFLRHPDSYTQVIHEAVHIGGDTDTIASMAGALAGAFLGAGAIPSSWLTVIHEETYTARAIEGLADRLLAKFP